jgi:tyrosyl-tRNA synthetase
MPFRSPLLSLLQDRGLIAGGTDNERLDRMLADGWRFSVYAGFDPTADSLHVGHLTTLRLLRTFKEHGHHILPLVGSATARVGDPTGRTTSRPVLTYDALASNAGNLHRTIRHLFRGPTGTTIVEAEDNADWFEGRTYLSFTNDVGRHVTVKRLLSMGTMAERLENGGLTFQELGYALMQAYDFRTLAKVQASALIQVGGSDQMGNIAMGLHLIGAMDGAEAAETCFGLTHPLLLKPDGTKMGKTSDGAVWLNADKLSPFDFYQWFRNLPDGDVETVALSLTGIDAGLIRSSMGDPERINALKEMVAMEVTAWVHDATAAEAARSSSRSGGLSAEGLEETQATPDELRDAAALLVKTGLAASQTRARTLAEQGGFRVNGQKRTTLALGVEDIREDGRIILSAGRSRHAAVVVTR